jgi:hypothetical protein
MPPAPEPREFTDPLPEPTVPLNQELVTNGGFEEWVPPLPYLWHTGSEDYIEAFHNARTDALAVLLKPSPRGEITVTQHLPLKKTAAGKRLTAEAFARSTAPNEAFIEVMFTTAAGVQKNRRWYTPSDGWNRVEIVVELPEDLRSDSVGIRMGRASGSRGFVAFDDCSARLTE